MSRGAVLVDRLVVEPTARLDFTIPADPAHRGIDIDIDVSPTFKPGPQDPRELGLAFDAIACEPAQGSTPRPAASVLLRGSAAAAIAGAVIGLAGLPALAAVGASLAVAAGQSWSLGSGGAAYSLSVPPVFLLAGLFALFCLLPVALAAGVLRRPLGAAARLAVVVSASAFYLKLIFLLHPDKDIVDAVFHAHRLDWVLAGRFYFTQLSTSATPFPYAIGLYVFSAPWSLLTDDHVMLLRIVVCATEAVAGALLYPLILRAWGDRATGVMAVLLFHVLPIPYTVIGNANQTAMFGQSVGLATMIAAIAWAIAPRGGLALAGLTALASLAFLSHVGTLAFLLPTLLVLAALVYLSDAPGSAGEARGPDRRGDRPRPGHCRRALLRAFRQRLPSARRESSSRGCRDTRDALGAGFARCRINPAGTASAGGSQGRRSNWASGARSARRGSASAGPSSCWRLQGRGALPCGARLTGW